MEDPGPMKVLKAARVLRPLKLVSGVPSMFNSFFYDLNSGQKYLRICGIFVKRCCYGVHLVLNCANLYKQIEIKNNNNKQCNNLNLWINGM